MDKELNMKVSYPNPKTIDCRNCIYRDRTTVKIGDKEKAVGLTKGFCYKFQDGAGKPHDVLFENAECPEKRAE